ncbi:MAG TPA: hypothetical protein VIM56_12140 [Rhizomicrobium sp.]
MNRTCLAAFAAILCASAATPALADWDNIGSVSVSHRSDRDTRTFDLGGPIDRLSLRAEGSDIDCRSVNATFGNGRTRQVYSGRLYGGRSTNVDLPGDNRNIRRLSFNCRAREFGGGTIRIAADIGSHRDEWRRNPNFARVWARMFNWGSNAMNNWRYVGQESFEGRRDRESAFTGWRGRNIDSIALKPLDANARCSRVTAMFGNGRTQDLNVNGGDFMRQGQYYKVDLPGDRRNLTSLNLRCRATDARRVTIQIFTGR